MSLVSIRNYVFQARFVWRYVLLGAALALLILSVFVALSVRDAIEGTKDTQCRGNLFYLQTAISEYRDNFGCLPPPFISDSTGKPLYSWRVLYMASCGDGLLEHDEFEFTKPWDDPINIKVDQRNGWRLYHLFCCPSISHETTNRTNYFYALSAEDRWPRDFYYDAQAPPKILFVETQALDVYWSEPVDFVYDVGPQGFLQKLRESKTPHQRWLATRDPVAPQQRGFNCITSDRRSMRIPADPDEEQDLRIVKLFDRQPEKEAGWEKEHIEKLVAKATKILGDSRKEWRLQALLLLSELGPRAKSSAGMIRRVMVMDEEDPRLKRVAAMALAKMEK